MKHDKEIIVNIHSLQETKKLAKKLANFLFVPLNFGLIGELGAGKTTFIREILSHLNIKGNIKSPTYTILESYETLLKNKLIEIYHFDAYRINNITEWYEGGFDEYFKDNSLTFIEWVNKIELLNKFIDIEIKIVIDDNYRIFFIKAKTDKGLNYLNTLFDN